MLFIDSDISRDCYIVSHADMLQSCLLATAIIAAYFDLLSFQARRAAFSNSRQSTTVPVFRLCSAANTVRWLLRTSVISVPNRSWRLVLVASTKDLIKPRSPPPWPP